MWLPTDIANETRANGMWLAPRRSFSAVDGSVLAVPDLFGSGNDGIQDTASSQPAIAQINGVPVLDLTNGYRFLNFTRDPSLKFVAIMAQYGSGEATTFSNWHTLLGYAGNSGSSAIIGRSGEPNWNVIGSVTGMVSANGGAQSSVALPMPMSLLTMSMQSVVGAAWGLGKAQNGNSSRNWPGYIGETIMLAVDPDAETLLRIEGYLAHVSGVAANMPISHPYRTSAPQIEHTGPMPVLWGPMDIPEPLRANGGWWDARAFTESEGMVSVITDLFGVRDQTQTSASSQPTVSSLNGIPSIQFNRTNTDQFFTSEAFAAKWGIVVLQYYDGISTAGAYAQILGDGGINNRVSTQPAQGIWQSPGSVSSGLFDGQTIKTSDMFPMELCSVSFELSGNSVAWGIGRGLTSTRGRSWHGHISACVMLGEVSDVNTRQKIEGYLHHRFGITSRLPVNHPYKTKQPEV